MKCITRCACTGLALLVIPAAFAAPMITLSDGPGNSRGGGHGGEFHAIGSDLDFTPVKLTTNSYFEVFCIERRETIAFNSAYYVDLSTQSDFNNDPISGRTAYLYSQFITGQLQSYFTHSNRVESANALQSVIWYLEDEITFQPWASGGGNDLNAAEQALAGLFYNNAVANATAGIGNVRVMNLYTHATNRSSTYHAQDQLVMIPAPGAIVLGMVGFSAVGAIRRRFA